MHGEPEVAGGFLVREVARAEKDSVVAGEGRNDVLELGPADILHRADRLPLPVGSDIGDLGPVVHTRVVPGQGVFEPLRAPQYGAAEKGVVSGAFLFIT